MPHVSSASGAVFLLGQQVGVDGLGAGNSDLQSCTCSEERSVSASGFGEERLMNGHFRRENFNWRNQTSFRGSFQVGTCLVYDYVNVWTGDWKLHPQHRTSHFH